MYDISGHFVARSVDAALAQLRNSLGRLIT